MRKKILFLIIAVMHFSYLLSQVDFRKETIYFLITSRFFDGDSTNNAPTEWCSYINGVNNPNITDPHDVSWRGDFKGLIEKLDYIKGMGFTAIWITPVVENRSPLDYHGYHAWDFTKVDPRLESTGATFQDLINAVHAKGMKLVLDIVTNHSSRYGIKGVAELKYNTDTTQTWGKNSLGKTLQPNPSWDYDGITPNPDDGKIWSRANIAKMPSPYSSNLAAWNWPCTESFVNTSDPNYFHHSGNGFVQGWDDTTNCYQRAISDDCPDLNTGSQTVQDYMYNAYSKFINMGVDAFRWDTWKHMNKGDILTLADRFKALNPNLFIFGEVAQKRFDLHPVTELNPHWYSWRGAVGSSAPSGLGLLDFYGEATFHNTFENGGAFSGVTDAARYDYLYSDPSILVTWLDNHDFGPNNDWNMRYSGSPENLASCFNFMFTWRGIPCVYYGTEEQFQKGVYCDIHDASGIQKSLDLTGRAYYGNEFSKAQNSKLYKHLKKLNDIRRAVPALQSGSWGWAGNYPGNGIGYTRTLGSQVVAVGLAKDGSASFNFTGLSNGVYKDAVTGRSITVTNGNLSFTVQSNSAGIYVLNGTGMIGESGAGYFEPCASGCNNVPPTLTISPVSDNYYSPITVSLSSAGGTGNVNIYYTTDGSTPSVSSTKYTSSFTVNAATVIKAIAIDGNGNVSDIQGQNYTFVLAKPKVSISPASGNYYNPISVNLSAGGNGTKAPYSIYYTTDGTAPTISSTKYNSAFSVSTATTVNAIAIDSNNQVSNVYSSNYTFIIPSPAVSASPVSGNFPTGNVSVTLAVTSPRPPVKIYYTTDGSTPSLSSSLYSTAINLNGPTTSVIKYFAVDNDGRTGSVDSSKYTFSPIPDIWVYFKKPSNWASTVKIHYWNALPSGALTATTWPGVNTTQACTNGMWWAFKFSGVTAVNVVFNDGAGKQTVNLNNITQTSYFDYNTLLPSALDIYAPAGSLTSTPLAGTVPLTVNFDASASTGCSVLNYFWDFGDSILTQTNLSATVSHTYMKTGIYNMNVIIQDQNNKRDTVWQTITVSNTSNSMTIHLKPAVSWTNVPPYFYYWNTVPVTNTTTWPGVPMVSEGNGWYKYTLSGDTCASIVFNNNTSPQSSNLSHCNDGWYDGTTNAWVSSPVVYTTWYTNAAGASNVNSLSSWGINADGTGTNPASFQSVSNGFYSNNFVLANSPNNNYILTADWNVGASNFTIPSTATINTGSYHFNLLGGDLTNNGSIAGNGGLSLGNSSNPAQYISGTGTISNLTLNNAAGAVITSGNSNKQTITQTFTPAAGTLNTNGNLILGSSITGTGRIAQGSGTYLNGNVTVQRYLGSGNVWRMVGFPFTAATTISQTALAGFYTSGYGAYTYNESSDNGAYGNSGSANAGWAPFTSGTVFASKGFLLNGGTKNATINFTGTLNCGTQTIALSYTSGNTNKGWNLIANPYASNINWTTIKANAANTNNLDNAIYRYDPNTTGYAAFVNNINAGNQSNVIENGAGFFVHSTGATSLTITESDKVATAPAASLFGTQPIVTDNKSIIKLSLLKDGETYGDEVVVRWGVDPATDNFDGAYDAYDLGRANGADLSVLGKDGTVYSIFHGSALQTKDKEQRIIALSTKNMSQGNYSINTSLLSAMFDGNEVYLVDHYTNQTILISKDYASYSFMVTSDVNSAIESRFSITLNNKSTADNTINTNLPVMLLNNPSTGNQFTLYSKNNYSQLQWQIVDALGKILSNGLFNNVTKGSTHQINAGNTSQGTYFIKLNGDGNALPVLKAIRN